MNVCRPSVSLLAFLAALGLVVVKSYAQSSGMTVLAPGNTQNLDASSVQNVSPQWAETVDRVVLNLVLSRRGELYRNGFSMSCCGTNDYQKEATSLAGRWLKRFGQFPVVIRAEVATRPEVSNPVIEVFREIGLTNVQCVVTGQTLHELNRRPLPRGSLTKSVPLTVLSLLLLSVLITTGVCVTRWAGRQLPCMDPTQDVGGRNRWNPWRYITAGILVSVLLTVVANYVQPWQQQVGGAWQEIQKAAWWTVVGIVSLIGITREWKRFGRRTIPIVLLTVLAFCWYCLAEQRMFPSGLSEVAQWVLMPAESLGVVFAFDAMLTWVLDSETDKIVLLVLFGSVALNGMVGFWVGYVVSRIKVAPEVVWRGGPVDWGRRTLVVLPFVLPVLFSLLYEPVNLRHTMSVFGWGNHTVGFNAGSVNAVLGSLVLCLSWMSMFFGVRFVRGARRGEYLWVGALIVVLLTSWSFTICGLAMW